MGGGKGSDGDVHVYADLDGDGLLSDDRTDAFRPFGVGYRGGVVVAAGDLSNSGGDELIVGHGAGGDSRILIFEDADGDRAVSDELGGAREDFFAFDAKQRGGVFLATGTLGGVGSGGEELLVSAGRREADILVFSDQDADGFVADDGVRQTLPAYSRSRGGVRITTGDVDGTDAFDEVLVIPGKGKQPELRIFDDSADADTDLDDVPTDEFVVPPARQRKGSFIATARLVQETHAFGNVVAIPDGGQPGDPLTVSLFVPASAGLVRGLDVVLGIEHTANSDLDVTLTHVPTGTSLVLFTDVGSDDDGFLVRLDDDAVTDIGTVANDPNDKTVVGTFNPEGAATLADFDGLDASGEWQLTIDDDTPGETGRLLGFTLVVELD